MKNRQKPLLYSGVLFTLLGVLLVSHICKDMTINELKNEIKMDYQRTFTEMVQYVDDLELNLEKSRFVNDPEQMIKLSGEIYSQASAASSNLALLPLKTEPLENLSEFLNQSGEYAQTLSHKMLNGEEITDEEYNNLAMLSEYAQTVAAELDKDLESLYNGTLDIRRAADGATATGIDNVLGEIEDQLHDYPALIYDGPFSSHLTDRESVFLKDKNEISEEDALNAVKMFFGEGAEFSCVEEKGNIPVYYLYDKSGTCSIVITKQGGYLLSYLNDRNVGEAVKTVSEAKETGKQFLSQIGFEGMEENYYETIGSVAVINYAPKQDGYTLYPDLIKVKVALDTGEIIGCETRGYLMYHQKREIPEIKISSEEAVSKVNPNVSVISVTLAVIPQDGGSEDFCWQIEGQIDERRCLIYVNTQTGAEEKLFLLIESETGVLAV